MATPMAVPSTARSNVSARDTRVESAAGASRSSKTTFSAAAESRQRLYPSIGNPHYLVLAKRRQIFAEWIGQIAGDNLRVLDVGGRVQPYRPLLGIRVAQYVALDPVATEMVDLVGAGEQIPVESDLFDVVFCTQVLQLVDDPAVVIDEIYRVLRPGGSFLLSVPSSSPRFADSDGWRFLPPALRTLLRSFSHVIIMPEGGTISGFFRTINSYLYIFARRPLLTKALGFTLFPALNIAGLMLDRFSNGNDSYAVNYSVLAIK